ncbi:DUF1217 domain-containing protein [Candidatus Liberibacter americanus]|uniref:Uncharacterized protein n=1 Tax=Candidatus Liberibacter americanus str. Sao Paulo TaxID=1261131 RepID=U6B5L9_9HYPH|nr:DUF1217 domain-containing protein [Candidatus Liberibacter americanus]AHA28098.1 hypothetical protein lam_755 [Candidatus Liberibacter americanus str. Sao Paulo]EMS36055.1 hypothetical protein G653_03641 [Candidatus Liberibacter americanus PW_SP]
MISQTGELMPMGLYNAKDKLISEISKRRSVLIEDDYYKKRIKEISTIDEFLQDNRLLRYALKAYGLSDLFNKKSMIRQILKSNSEDIKSFVNSSNNINSSKFRKFAQSFSFSLSDPPKVIQGNIQQERLISKYKNSYQLNEESAYEKSEYFRKNASKINSVDKLIADKKILDYVLNAFDINTNHISIPFLRRNLTHYNNNIENLLIKYGKKHMRQMAEYFNFKSDGYFDNKNSALTENKIENIINKYLDRKTYFVPEKNIANDRFYYESNINSISSIEKLVEDPILFKIIKISLSIDLKTSSKYFLKLVNSGSLNIKEFFQIHDPNKIGNRIQTTEQTKKILKLYNDNCHKLRNDYISSSIENYIKTLPTFGSVDDFLNSSPKLSINNNKITPLEVALRAYDIDKDTYKYVLRDVLTSDPNDPNSYINKHKDKRFINLNLDFNFDKNGNPKKMPMAHLPLTKKDYIAGYVKNKNNDYINNDKVIFSKKGQIKIGENIRSNVDYYINNIDKIDSFENLIADKDLMHIILDSKGIDSKKVSKSFLERIFKSDLADPKSFVNQYKDKRYKEIMLSFEFNSINKKIYKNNGKIQNYFHINKTIESYKNQILEDEVKDKNPDMELALYFSRIIPTINSTYEILSDKNIFNVVSKVCNLPVHFSSLNQKKQIDILTKKINIKDFQDPKKVQQFLYRFFYTDNVKRTDQSVLLLSQSDQYDLYNEKLPEVSTLSLSGTKLSLLDLFNKSSAQINYFKGFFSR